MIVHMRSPAVLVVLLLGVGFAAFGCMGQIEDREGYTASNLMLGIDPVGEVPEHVWREAPLGCEGRLPSDVDIIVARAENAPALGVALDEDGEPLCVDSWGAIHAELESIVKGDPSPDPMDRVVKHLEE
jgi:hypothetical protein